MLSGGREHLDPEDPFWVLNQYRAAEIHGAGAIMRMERLAPTSPLRKDLSRHLRDEAVHAWLWTRTIHELGGSVVEVDQPYQARLAAHFGIPRTLTEMLALTLISERRGLAEYEAHMDVEKLPAPIRRTLRGIVKDEAWHVRYIDEELTAQARENAEVAGIIERAEMADLQAVAELEQLLAE
jgi:hypothetical protein